MILRTRTKSDKITERNRIESAKQNLTPKNIADRRNKLEIIRSAEKADILSGLGTFYNKDFYFGLMGVYFLIKGREVVYVGSSECIMSRIPQHIPDKDFNCFKFILVPDLNEMLKVEADFIKKLCPIYNITHNPSMNKKAPIIIKAPLLYEK